MEIICKKDVEMLDKIYIVYLKEVATKLAVGGKVEKTTIRAFVKEKR